VTVINTYSGLQNSLQRAARIDSLPNEYPHIVSS
jgi:hypothetical protein